MEATSSILESGEMIEMDRIGNNYVMEAWIKVGNNGTVATVSDFPRQGARR